MTALLNKDGKIMITTGCFEGTIEEFKEAVEKEHGDNKYGRQYYDFIGCIKNKFNAMLEEDKDVE